MGCSHASNMTNAQTPNFGIIKKEEQEEEKEPTFLPLTNREGAGEGRYNEDDEELLSKDSLETPKIGGTRSSLVYFDDKLLPPPLSRAPSLKDAGSSEWSTFSSSGGEEDDLTKTTNYYSCWSLTTAFLGDLAEGSRYEIASGVTTTTSILGGARGRRSSIFSPAEDFSPLMTSLKQLSSEALSNVSVLIAEIQAADNKNAGKAPAVSFLFCSEEGECEDVTSVLSTSENFLTATSVSSSSSWSSSSSRSSSYTYSRGGGQVDQENDHRASCNLGRFAPLTCHGCSFTTPSCLLGGGGGRRRGGGQGGRRGKNPHSRSRCTTRSREPTIIVS